MAKASIGKFGKSRLNRNTEVISIKEAERIVAENPSGGTATASDDAGLIIAQQIFGG